MNKMITTKIGKIKLADLNDLPGLPYFNPFTDKVDDLQLEGEKLVRQSVKLLRQATDSDLDPLSLLTPIIYDGIGAVRCLYYRELILSTIYSSLTDGTSQAGTSYFVASGVRRDQNDWLIYDRFLAHCLTSLGTSWEAVEAAMLEGFYAALPEAFNRQYGPQARPQTLVDWEMTWTTRDTIKQSGLTSTMKVRKAKEAARFLTSLKNSATGLHHRLVRPETTADLNNLVALCESVAWAEQGVQITDFRTVKKSPIVTAVIMKAAEQVWEVITNQSKSLLYKGECFAPEKYGNSPLSVDIQDRSVPTEFWMLVSDMLYHCPILRGVPDVHFLATEDKPAKTLLYQQETYNIMSIGNNERRNKTIATTWPKMTEDAIRGRCEEYYGL
jgi:hypothetical protein